MKIGNILTILLFATTVVTYRNGGGVCECPPACSSCNIHCCGPAAPFLFDPPVCFENGEVSEIARATPTCNCDSPRESESQEGSSGWSAGLVYVPVEAYSIDNRTDCFRFVSALHYFPGRIFLEPPGEPPRSSPA